MSDTAPWEDFKSAAPVPDSGVAPWEDFKPPTPRTGASAIPAEAEVQGKPYTPPAAPVAAHAQPPSFTDKITGAVEAAVNAATGIVGGFVGGVAALPGSAASAASELQRGGIGGFKRENVANPMEVMDSVSQGVGGALKRAVSGPMDLRQEQTPDSEMGQQYTEKYVQPTMENLIAAAPLHGTMGPKGGTKPAMQAAGDVRRGVVAPAANAAADAAAAGVGKVARKALGVDPELAKVAQTAGDLKYPIDVRPDQVVQGAKFTKLAGQASSDVPLANSKTASNQVAYTKNLIDLLNPEESKAERLTPEVFDQAMTRSGQGIGDIMAKTDVPEATLRSGAESLRENAEKFATDNDKRILGNYIAELLGKADDNGVINGTALKELNSEIGTRARSEAGNDLGRRLNDLQDVIQDAVQEHVDPADAAPLKDFRRQYAYGKMVEPLVAKTIDGVVSPSALMARVTATKQGKHYMARSMGGPIGDLAKVGQLIKEPGSSGTAERSLVYGAIKDVGKTAAAAAGGYPLAAAYNTFGPKLTRAMVGKRAKKAAPAEPPVEPTTSPGAGPGTPPAGGSGPGPLGDLTPDWQTTPGAGGGAPRGGNEPGLVPAVGEKPITRLVPDAKAETPSKRAGNEIPAVPGRPDLPDSMLTGRPKETAATERANAAMQEPGAQEAMRQQEAAKKLPVGETKELTPEQWNAADKKWRADHKLGEEDAGRARDVAQALKHDGPAVEAAARQHENSPRAFDREIARINEEGQARENESKQAAGGSEGDAGAAAPVREGEARPEPAAAVRGAGEQPGAERTDEAGTGRGGAEPAGRQGQVEIHEVPGGFEAWKDGKKVGYLKDNLERGQAKQLGESANVDMVKVDKDQVGQGVGRALYEAFNDKHEGAILPSGKTEPSAWKLWKRNYPEKVDEFVKTEAARIRDGADPGLVARNITDPEVRSAVLGFDTTRKIGDSFASRAKDVSERAEVDAATATRADVDGFTDAMSPMQRAKTEAALNQQQSVNGVLKSRKTLVRERIADGARVGVKEGQRALVSTDGRYLLEKQVSKTALDYAEHLIEKEKTHGTGPESDNQPGGVQQKAGEKGVPENDNPEEVFKEGQAAPVARKPVGSAGAMDMTLRERFGDKFIQGLKDQGILKYAPEGKRPTTGATFRTGSANEAPSATLFYNALTAEELPGTLMHELGEHFGIVRLLGNDRYGTMLNDLKALRDTDEVKDAWASVKRRYTDRPGANIPEGGATFMREVAAHLVESHPDLPFVRRLVNEIRAFFYENFGTTMGNRVDASLIRGLAASALRKASTGDLPKMKTPVYFVPKTQPAAGPRSLQ